MNPEQPKQSSGLSRILTQWLISACFILFLCTAFYALNSMYDRYTRPTDAHAATAKTEAANSSTTKAAAHCSTDHRFEKLEVNPINLRADIALDSCTGQVCRTHDWFFQGQHTKTAWDTYAGAPLCSELATMNP